MKAEIIFHDGLDFMELAFEFETSFRHVQGCRFYKSRTGGGIGTSQLQKNCEYEAVRYVQGRYSYLHTSPIITRVDSPTNS